MRLSGLNHVNRKGFTTVNSLTQGCFLPNHLDRILVFADPEKDGLPEPIIACPFREFDLADRRLALRRQITEWRTMGTNQDGVAEKDFDLWVVSQELVDDLETSGQILLIGVQVPDEIASRSRNALGQRIVHTKIGFNKQTRGGNTSEPFQTLSIAAVLNDVLAGDSGLVGNGSGTEPDPIGLLKSRRDNGEFHIRALDSVAFLPSNLNRLGAQTRTLPSRFSPKTPEAT